MDKEHVTRSSFHVYRERKRIKKSQPANKGIVRAAAATLERAIDMPTAHTKYST